MPVETVNTLRHCRHNIKTTRGLDRGLLVWSYLSLCSDGALPSWVVLGKAKPSQEVLQIAGEHEEPESHLVGHQPMLGGWCLLEGIFAVSVISSLNNGGAPRRPRLRHNKPYR